MSTLPFTMRGAPVIVYGLRLIDGQSRPHLLAGRRRRARRADRRACRRRRALPDRDAAVDDVAAGACPVSPGTCGSYCQSSLPVSASSANTLLQALVIHHAVDDDRRRFMPRVVPVFQRPREPELADVLVVDLIERREALLGVGAAVFEPVARLLVGVDDALRIDGHRLFANLVGARICRRSRSGRRRCRVGGCFGAGTFEHAQTSSRTTGADERHRKKRNMISPPPDDL